ncbi:MAG: 3-dehydroquinate dehydratase [Desulfarculaceae bacterium]|nr:3-dehydroquinate dehydratase [Desulfarculaceae bacterium]
MLGKREPHVYGTQTLDDINTDLAVRAKKAGLEVIPFQTNHEGEIVEKLHGIFTTGAGAVILNAAAYTHTSVAIRDAVSMLDIPVIEVHLSNIYKREAFRHKSLPADVVTGQITGFGSQVYRLALEAVRDLIHAG